MIVLVVCIKMGLELVSEPLINSRIILQNGQKTNLICIFKTYESVCDHALPSYQDFLLFIYQQDIRLSYNLLKIPEKHERRDDGKIDKKRIAIF